MFALQAMVFSYIIRFTCSLHNLTFPLNFNQYHALAAQPFMLPSSCQACGLKGGPCMPFQRQRDEKWCMATLRKGYPWYQVWIPSGLDRLDVRSCISLFFVVALLLYQFSHEGCPLCRSPHYKQDVRKRQVSNSV